ncbi:MAG: hypothetical protein WBQ11_23720, partial [Isosphaeraceae bacterium]
RQLADPARRPLAPVLVPHIADDKRRLRRLPFQGLLLDREPRPLRRRRLAEPRVQDQRFRRRRSPPRAAHDTPITAIAWITQNPAARIR